MSNSYRSLFPPVKKNVIHKLHFQAVSKNLACSEVWASDLKFWDNPDIWLASGQIYYYYFHTSAAACLSVREAQIIPSRINNWFPACLHRRLFCSYLVISLWSGNVTWTEKYGKKKKKIWCLKHVNWAVVSKQSTNWQIIITHFKPSNN